MVPYWARVMLGQGKTAICSYAAVKASVQRRNRFTCSAYQRRQKNMRRNQRNFTVTVTLNGCNDPTTFFSDSSIFQE